MHLFLCFLFWLALVRSDDEIFKLIQQNDVEQLKLKLTTDNKNERGTGCTLEQRCRVERISFLGPGQQTPIMHAVLTGKVDVVEFLLANDVDLTLGLKFFETDQKKVKLLLQARKTGTRQCTAPAFKAVLPLHSF